MIPKIPQRHFAIDRAWCVRTIHSALVRINTSRLHNISSTNNNNNRSISGLANCTRITKSERERDRGMCDWCSLGANNTFRFCTREMAKRKIKLGEWKLRVTGRPTRPTTCSIHCDFTNWWWMATIFFRTLLFIACRHSPPFLSVHLYFWMWKWIS